MDINIGHSEYYALKNFMDSLKISSVWDTKKAKKHRPQKEVK